MQLLREAENCVMLSRSFVESIFDLLATMLEFSFPKNFPASFAFRDQGYACGLAAGIKLQFACLGSRFVRQKVKGNCLMTLALPFPSNSLASAGWQGISVLRLLEVKRTLCITYPGPGLSQGSVPLGTELGYPNVLGFRR